MADNTDTDTQGNDELGAVCEKCGVPEKTQHAFAKIRTESAQKDERIEALSEQALSSGIAAAGFELTVADEDGQAKENKHLSLVVSKWLEDNPQVEEFDPEQFTSFASEYGVQPAAAQGGEPEGESGGAGGEPSAAETQAEALASMHQQGENLRNASTQPTPTSGGLDDQIREAEQANDAETVKRLNNRKVSQMLLDTAGQQG